MAQAEGTSKNDGRVGSSVSGASGNRSTSSSSSSRTEKDDGRPTSRGISESKSRTSSFGSSGRSGAANSNPSSKTGKSAGASFGKSTASSIGQALGSLLGGSLGGKIGGSIGDSVGHLLSRDVPGRTVRESELTSKAAAPTRDFSGLGGNYGPMANKLASAGWTNSMIAGYLGSIRQESGGNTRARNKGDASDGTDSVGAGQWNMDRLANLQKFGGADMYDPATQAGFTLHELATTHRHVADKLANAEDNPEAYAGIFGRNYEVSKQIPERQRYARGFADQISQLGIPDVEKSFKKVDDFVASIQNVNKPIGEKPTSQNTDPLGIGTFLADTLGIQNPNTGKQKDGTYVDPMVSSVEGRRRRGESDGPTETKGRSGIAGIGEKAQQGKPLGVAAGMVKAVTDPIGFGIETIVDLGNQTRGMNTPGPEGEGGDYSQQEFGLGFLKSFLNGGSGSSGGFAPSEKGGSGSSPALTAQTPVSQSVAITAAPALTPVTAADASVTPARKPFQWSTITGTLDNILGTTYNG